MSDWPPAKIFGLGWVARSSTASDTVVGQKYSKSGGFMRVHQRCERTKAVSLGSSKPGDLGRLGGDVLGRAVKFVEEAFDLRGGHQRDIDLQLLRFGNEVGILERGVESIA